MKILLRVVIVLIQCVVFAMCCFLCPGQVTLNGQVLPGIDINNAEGLPRGVIGDAAAAAVQRTTPTDHEPSKQLLSLSPEDCLLDSRLPAVPILLLFTCDMIPANDCFLQVSFDHKLTTCSGVFVL